MDNKKLAKQVGEILGTKGFMLAVAESCTGGWLSQVITSNPGSGQYFDRGFIVYSNESKIEMLGVSSSLLEQYEAVSEETARAMAEGALKNSRSNVAIAITGLAGPDGATPGKPIGTVWFAWALRDEEVHTRKELLTGNRESIRRESVTIALRELLHLIRNKK